MHPSSITSFNIGLLPADLPGWFALPNGHPYARIENIPIQFYLIALPERLVLVDAPAYNFPEDDGNTPLPEYIGRTAAGLLTESGVRPEAITDVFITHPHLDHTLGLVDELSTPVFANARHYLSLKDWQDPRLAEIERIPFEGLQKAGLLTLVDGPLNLGDGLTLLPAPGETPGHQIVLLKNDDGESYIAGDLFHHVLEFDEPECCPVWADAEIMRVSKFAFMQRVAESGAKVYFTHIASAWTVDTRQQPPIWKQSQP